MRRKEAMAGIRIIFSEEVNVVLDETVPEGEAWLCLAGMGSTPERRLATIAGMEELLDEAGDEESDAGAGEARGSRDG
jgi:hypothetical protein